ncbi:hypothetical protein TUMEXPCC7403_18340 [Tumidithrix helvetica PCC 7403]|uniref:hypothetical protein n=1 Tax=Tumidithrix helvetica TaxID=3457545 RepID=UPI003C85B5CA
MIFYHNGIIPLSQNYRLFNPRSLGAAQGFTLTARPNQLPIINSDTPPTKATPDIPSIYDLRATDPAGGILKCNLDPTSQALGITIDDLGRVRMTPLSIAFLNWL